MGFRGGGDQKFQNKYLVFNTSNFCLLLKTQKKFKCQIVIPFY